MRGLRAKRVKTLKADTLIATVDIGLATNTGYCTTVDGRECRGSGLVFCTHGATYKPTLLHFNRQSLPLRNHVVCLLVGEKRSPAPFLLSKSTDF